MQSQQEQWQHKFGYVFTLQIQEVIQREVSDENEAFHLFAQLKLQDKKKFWVKIAEILQIKPKSAHDYFHNTWSRRFCCDFSEYKPEAKEIINDLDTSLVKKDQFSILFNTLQTRHPNVIFHYQTVYQYFNYIIRKGSLCSESVERSGSNLSTFSTLSNSSIKSFSSILGDDFRMNSNIQQKRQSKLYQVLRQDDDESDEEVKQLNEIQVKQQSINPNLQQQALHINLVDENKNEQQHNYQKSSHNSFGDYEYFFEDFKYFDMV